MGVFGAHQGNRRNDNDRKGRVAQHVLIAVAGLLAFWISFREVLPADLYTSAKFFDALGLQPVFDQGASAFSIGIWQDVPDVSREAFAFAVSLLLIQILVGYMASTAGGYTNQSKNLISLASNIISGREKPNRGNLNWAKVGWISFYWIVALFDTYTDTAYRAYFGQGQDFNFVINALVTSFVFYNLASEWMIVVGSKAAFSHTVAVIGELKSGINLPKPVNSPVGNINQQRGKNNQHRGRK